MGYEIGLGLVGSEMCIKDRCRRIWSDMGGYGRIWYDMGGYERIWHTVDSKYPYPWITDMGIWSDMDGYGAIWTDMGGYGAIWADKSGQRTQWIKRIHIRG